ncbi:MAG TPA: hypothetical protein VKF41_03030 [Bryobacteraceae bacterium]|nr:hypothetical protein [Bryobacteraceae bacterium]
MAGSNITLRDRGIPRIHAAGIPLRFGYNLDGIAHQGSGRVSDLGRRAIRFQTDHPPPSGAELELRLDWAFHWQMVSPPELVIRGAALRTGSWGTVVRMHQYGFYHCGERPFDQAVAKAGPHNVIG